MNEIELDLNEEDLKNLEQIKKAEEIITGEPITMNDVISKIIQEEHKRLIKSE